MHGYSFSVLAVLLPALLAGLPVELLAAPVQLDCRYPQVADPREGLRDARDPLSFRFTIDKQADTASMTSGDFSTDLELRFSQRHLTLFQTTGSDALNVTVIVFEAFDDSDLFRSVHSRHAMIGSLGELRASQHYGRCVPVGDQE